MYRNELLIDHCMFVCSVNWQLNDSVCLIRQIDLVNVEIMKRVQLEK